MTESRCLAMRLERAGRQMESVLPQMIKDQFLGSSEVKQGDFWGRRLF